MEKQGNATAMHKSGEIPNPRTFFLLFIFVQAVIIRL